MSESKLGWLDFTTSKSPGAKLQICSRRPWLRRRWRFRPPTAAIRCRSPPQDAKNLFPSSLSSDTALNGRKLDEQSRRRRDRSPDSDGPIRGRLHFNHSLNDSVRYDKHDGGDDLCPDFLNQKVPNLN